MSYSFVPITTEEIPLRHAVAERTTRAKQIIEGFLATGHSAARLEYDWPEGSVSNGQLLSLRSCLKRYAKQQGIGIDVFKRGWNLYIVRVDQKSDEAVS